jgi:hypothetical protein
MCSAEREAVFSTPLSPTHLPLHTILEQPQSFSPQCDRPTVTCAYTICVHTIRVNKTCYEEHYLLGYDAVQAGTYGYNTLLPSSSDRLSDSLSAHNATIPTSERLVSFPGLLHCVHRRGAVQSVGRLYPEGEVTNGAAVLAVITNDDALLAVVINDAALLAVNSLRSPKLLSRHPL